MSHPNHNKKFCLICADRDRSATWYDDHGDLYSAQGAGV